MEELFALGPWFPAFSEIYRAHKNYKIISQMVWPATHLVCGVKSGNKFTKMQSRLFATYLGWAPKHPPSRRKGNVWSTLVGKRTSKTNRLANFDIRGDMSCVWVLVCEVNQKRERITLFQHLSIFTPHIKAFPCSYMSVSRYTTKATKGIRTASKVHGFGVLLHSFRSYFGSYRRFLANDPKNWSYTKIFQKLPK